MTTDDSTIVTAPVDTKEPATSDRFEVETNIEPTEVEDKGSKPQVEPTEAPPQPKPVNPRTEKRKAEKERLIRENAIKDEQLRQTQAELAALKAPKQEVKQKDPTKEPNVADYDDVLEYTRDMAKFEANNLLSERDQQYQSVQEQRLNEVFEEQLDEVRATTPDIDDKIQTLYDAGLIPPTIERAVLSSSMSGKLAEHLANFPGDLQQLNSIRPELLPKAIKSIEVFIKKGPQVEKPRLTNAAPPISPPGNGAKTDRSINSYSQEEIENMPISEFKKLTNMK